MQLGETNEVPGKILDNQKKKKVSKRRQNHVIQNDQIDWPLTLKRNVASNGNDLNANINEGAPFDQNGWDTVANSNDGVSVQAIETNTNSHSFHDTEKFLPVKLYEAEIARQANFSLAAGTLKRRIIPCCSQFYYGMVVLGKTPPFEGLFPCEMHNNYYAAWRRSVVDYENKKMGLGNKKTPANLDTRAKWKDKFHKYNPEKYELAETLPVVKGTRKNIIMGSPEGSK